MEATVTPSNHASSQRMFERLAARHEAPVARRPFLDADDFPERHEAEILLEIGPFPHSRYDLYSRTRKVSNA